MSLPFDSAAAARAASHPALVPITTFAGPLTRADLEAIPEDGRRYELIDGCLIVTPSPGPPHQLMLGELYLALHAAQTAEWYTILALDYMASEFTTFVPDLLVVDRDERRRGGKGTRPELVVEVLSPSTSHIDRGLKRAAFAAAGVPLYWIIDPRQAVAARPRAGRRRVPRRRSGRGRRGVPRHPTLPRDACSGRAGPRRRHLGLRRAGGAGSAKRCRPVRNTRTGGCTLLLIA